jgi:hypothetical protein
MSTVQSATRAQATQIQSVATKTTQSRQKPETKDTLTPPRKESYSLFAWLINGFKGVADFLLKCITCAFCYTSKTLKDAKDPVNPSKSIKENQPQTLPKADKLPKQQPIAVNTSGHDQDEIVAKPSPKTPVFNYSESLAKTAIKTVLKEESESSKASSPVKKFGILSSANSQAPAPKALDKSKPVVQLDAEPQDSKPAPSASKFGITLNTVTANKKEPEAPAEPKLFVQLRPTNAQSKTPAQLEPTNTKPQEPKAAPSASKFGITLNAVKSKNKERETPAEPIAFVQLKPTNMVSKKATAEPVSLKRAVDLKPTQVAAKTPTESNAPQELATHLQKFKSVGNSQ